ncbi:MAG: hypothetical protein AAGG38_00240 [Planctomycetota bacterium]
MVELLVATALAALLLMGLMRVTAATAVSVHADTPGARHGEALRRAADMIESDLQRARYQRLGADHRELALVGYLAHPPRDGDPGAAWSGLGLRPAVVVYWTQDLGGRLGLFRGQRELLADGTSRAVSHTLLLVGVETWRVSLDAYPSAESAMDRPGPSETGATGDRSDPLLALAGRARELKPLARVRIAMTAEAGGAVVDRRVVRGGGDR